MGRPLNDFLIQFLAAPTGETQTTVELALKNGQFRRFATAELLIDGKFFADGLIEADDIDESEDAATDRTEIVIQNADKAIGLDIKAGVIHFASVSLGRMFKRSDGVWEWREIFFGEAVPLGYNEQQARIEIVDDMIAAGYCVANWTLVPVCRLPFKGPECGYQGPETFCNHLLKGDCAKYQNTHRHVSETFPFVKNTTAPTAPPPTGGYYPGDDDLYDGRFGRNRYQKYPMLDNSYTLL